MELTKNTSSHGQPFCKVERNIAMCLTLIWKETQRNTPKKLSRTYHLIMSIFSLFHFVAFMKLFATISG